MKLPAETRNQIYRYLLRDDDAHIFLVNQPTTELESAQLDDRVTTRSPEQDTAVDTKESLICLPDEAAPFRLFPEILGTSRQIYNEAVNILYGENVCYYALWISQFEDVLSFRRKLDFSRRALQQLSWLRMTVVEDEDEGGRLNTELLDGLEQLSSPECSLLGFRLDMQFFSHPATSCDHQPPLSQFVLQDARFSSALIAWKALERLRIHVCDDTMGSAGHFSEFIQSVMTEKNWRCTTGMAMHYEPIPIGLCYGTWDLVPVVKNSLVIAQAPSLWSEEDDY